MPALLVFAAAYGTAAAAGFAAYAALAGSIASALYSAAEAKHKSRKAERRARDEFNAALQDRMVMVDITPNAPRTLALGRVRSVEGIRRRWASGTHDEKLTLIVSFAGHEIDAFETFYFDDVELTLDGSGYVQTEPWLKSGRIPGSTSLTLDSVTFEAVYTIPGTLVAGSAVASGGDENFYYGCVVTMDGNEATVSVPGGPPPGVSLAVTLHWQTSTGTSLARIRTYLGTDAQNVGDDLEAEYPGKITAGDAFRGIALAVVDLTYDPDAFPQGVPNLTALFRGAKVLDPRDDSTAWSENPALLAYHYARHANGWDVPIGSIREADIIAAANECDISTDYVMRMPDDSTSTVTLPRFRCGIVVSTAADPRANMDEIMESMAGRWGWAGGVLRMRAGMSADPVFALDPGWVAQRLDAAGQPSGDSVVRITNGVPREDRINRIGGTCVDPDQRWQALPFPSISHEAYVTADGGEHLLEVEYQGVNHIAHAQHLAAVTIREARAALRAEIACNLHAYRTELFDVGEVTLPRYGFTSKLFEVTGWRWHPQLGVQLTLAETSAAIFDTDELDGRDPAPNSDLPRLTTVEDLTGLDVDSGTVALSDGSLLMRSLVTWDAAESDAVRQGGAVEVQYTPANATLPTGAWPSTRERGDAESATVAGLKQGTPYLFRARFVNSLGVRGKWSVQVQHVITVKSKVFRLVATGHADEEAPAGAGLYSGDTATLLRAGARSYNIARIRRSDAVMTYRAAYDLMGVPGYDLDALVGAMAQQLGRMSSTRYAPATPHGLGNRYVRPTLTHNSVRDGLSYATAWGGADEIDWGDLGADKTLWICGTWTDTSFSIGAGGTSGHAFDIRLDHSSDPARIWNSAPIDAGDWTDSGVNGEFWIDTVGGLEIGSAELMLYVDGERGHGCSKSSGNTRPIRFTVDPVSATYNAGNSSITFLSLERVYETGDKVLIPTSGDDAARPTPLVKHVQYYAIALADDTIQFAASYADAIAGTEITITDWGNGDIWKIFHEAPTQDPYLDPQIGSLAAGQYWWDGVNKRLYWKPVSGDPTDYETALSVDRSASVGACIYVSAQDYVRIWGGGEYGGLFGVAPRGQVGRCHTNAIQYVNSDYGVIDGVAISGCRSGLAYAGGTGHVSRNCRVTDTSWHGVGGESGSNVETNLLHERHWISDVGRKFDWGDMQAIVFNAGNDDSHIRRNLIERCGRNAANCNHGVVVSDNSQRSHIYRNIIDDCYGCALEVGAGSIHATPNRTNTDSSFSSNIIYRHNRDLGEYGSNQAFETAVYQLRVQKDDSHLERYSLFGNLVAWSRTFESLPAEPRGLFHMRAARPTAYIEDIVFERNAHVMLPLAADMYGIVSQALQATPPPDPTFTSDLNIWSGSWPFLFRERTGESDESYDAAHVVGGSAGYWSFDSGQDEHSEVSPSTDIDLDDAPELTDAMLEFLRQDDDYDSLDAPTIEGVGLFPFAGGGDADAAADMAADLDATANTHVVAVWTLDDAQPARLTAALLAAMYRCGASPGVYGSPEVLAGSAYALVGIGGIGKGNGFEAYSGSVPHDTNAWTDVGFILSGGQLIVSGTSATPRTLADYAYTGELDATNGGTFGENINGQARTEDIEPGAVTAAAASNHVGDLVEDVFGTVIETDLTDVVTLLSTGAPVTVVGHTHFKVASTNVGDGMGNGDARSFVIEARLYIDGIEQTESKATASMLSQNLTGWPGPRAEVTLPITWRGTPSAGEHTYQGRVSFYAVSTNGDAVAQAVDGATYQVDYYFTAQENKV